LEVDRKLFSGVMRGRKSITFSSDRLSDFAGLPWGSVVTLGARRGQGDMLDMPCLVGPARFAASRGDWYLPVIEKPDPGATIESLPERAAQWRTSHGLDERRSQ